MEQKLFTLKDIDENIEGLNLRLFDEDKPSLSGVSLSLPQIPIFINIVCSDVIHE